MTTTYDCGAHLPLTEFSTEKQPLFRSPKLRVLRPTGELCMSRSRVSISNCPDRKTIAPSLRSCAGSPKRYGFSAALAPPVCFISALALTWVIGGVGAAADSGGCTSTVPGVDLTCTGTVVNPAAFTATTDFNVNIWATTTPDDPATITRTSDNAGLQDQCR